VFSKKRFETSLGDKEMVLLRMPLCEQCCAVRSVQVDWNRSLLVSLEDESGPALTAEKVVQIGRAEIN